METRHDPDYNFPCARATEQDDESFSVITWTFGTRKFLNCTSNGPCAQKLQWNPVSIQPEKICSRVQSRGRVLC